MRTKLALLTVAAALVFPASAAAHAILVRADPVDGSSLGSAPQRIQLFFSERISPRFRSVQLLGPQGRRLHLTAAGPASTLTIAAPRLVRGTYTLVWRVLSEDDGHITNGTLVFGIGTRATPAADRTPTPAAVDVVLRWLFFAMPSANTRRLLAGFLPPSPRSGLGSARADAPVPARRVLAVTAAAGGLALVVQAAVLARQVQALAQGGTWKGTLRDLLLSSRWGLLWLAQLCLLTLLVAVATGLRRRAPHVAARAAAFSAVAVGALVAVEALGSHAAALGGAPFAVAVDAAHVLGASVWIGAVAALAVASAGRGDAIEFAVALRRPFALLAGASLFVAVLSGLYAAGAQVASIDALLTTLYGRALLAKTALVVAAGAFGLTNALLLTLIARGRVRPRRVLPRVLTVELLGGLAIFLAAGVLTATAPARGPAFAPKRPVHEVALAGQARDLIVSLSIRPNRPGQNVFTVVAASSRRPPPAPLAEIALRLPDRRTAVLQAVASGRFVGVGKLDSAGPTRARVVIRRDGARLATGFGWTVESPDPARPVKVSNRRLATLTNPAALLLLLAVAAAAACALVARSARRQPARRVALAPVPRRPT